MGSTEKFCLRWNDFETNISAAFRELREDKDFFDVTIACDDDQLQAHKVILSACSPFFRTILRRNKHEHPLLYLKGVKYADLVSVLNFMYHGEVNVAQEELNSFLAVAEDLKVKGLTQNNSETSKFNPSEVSTHHKPHQGNNLVSEKTKPIPKTLHTTDLTPVSKRVTPTIYQEEEEDDIQEVVAVKSEPTPVQAEAPTQYTAMVEQPFSTTTQQNNAGIMANPTMEYEEEEYADYGGYGGYEGIEGGYSEVGGQEGFKEIVDLTSQSMSLVEDENGQRLWNCDLCLKTNKNKAMMRRHMETHLKVKHQCQHCEKQAPSREALRIHISRNHRY